MSLLALAIFARWPSTDFYDELWDKRALEYESDPYDLCNAPMNIAD